MSVSWCKLSGLIIIFYILFRVVTFMDNYWNLQRCCQFKKIQNCHCICICLYKSVFWKEATTKGFLTIQLFYKIVRAIKTTFGKKLSLKKLALCFFFKNCKIERNYKVFFNNFMYTISTTSRSSTVFKHFLQIFDTSIDLQML